MSESNSTKNSSVSSGGLEIEDGMKGESTPGLPSFHVPKSAPDNNNKHAGSNDNIEDGFLVFDENKLEQPNVPTRFQNQDQDPSNCDNLLPGGSRCHLSQYVSDSDGLRQELDDSDNKIEFIQPNGVNEKVVDKGSCDSVKRTGNLKVESEGRKSLEKNTEHIRILSKQEPIRQKPGVILLGRGNSFSRGRSEVIVLHHRPKSSSERLSGKLGIKENKLVTISERQGSVENDDVVKLNRTGVSDSVVPNRSPKIPSSSPPPISNGLYQPDSQQMDLNGDRGVDGDNSTNRVIELVPCYEDDLQKLWCKAESLMALRKDRVCQILEEFGIGEPGGGGGEDESYWEDEDVTERRKEEEDVWQIVQGNRRV